MKVYLTAILVPLIENPQALEISESESDQGTLLTVKLSGPDMGRVIGKSGDTIKSIRTLIHAAGSRLKKTVNVKVLEPQRK